MVYCLYEFSYTIISIYLFLPCAELTDVQVEGDGRLVPATDDEVMEVEDFLIDDKTEMHVITDTGKTAECIPTGGSSCLKLHIKSSEGLHLSYYILNPIYFGVFVCLMTLLLVLL